MAKYIFCYEEILSYDRHNRLSKRDQNRGDLQTNKMNNRSKLKIYNAHRELGITVSYKLKYFNVQKSVFILKINIKITITSTDLLKVIKMRNNIMFNYVLQKKVMNDNAC